MPNIGESPKDEKESFLSGILETIPNPKYFLSQKACQGILKRAASRGEELPKALMKTLSSQSGSGTAAKAEGKDCCTAMKKP